MSADVCNRQQMFETRHHAINSSGDVCDVSQKSAPISRTNIKWQTAQLLKTPNHLCLRAQMHIPVPWMKASLKFSPALGPLYATFLLNVVLPDVAENSAAYERTVAPKKKRKLNVSRVDVSVMSHSVVWK